MNKLTTSLTAAALAATFGLATIAPASADQAAANRNEIIGGLALVAGIATAINVSNKNAEADRQYAYGWNGAGYGNGNGYGGYGSDRGRGGDGWSADRDDHHPNDRNDGRRGTDDR